VTAQHVVSLPSCSAAAKQMATSRVTKPVKCHFWAESHIVRSQFVYIRRSTIQNLAYIICCNTKFSKLIQEVTLQTSNMQVPCSNFCWSMRLRYFYAHPQNCEKRLFDSLCLSVCPPVHPSALNNSAPTRWVLMKSIIWVFFENMSRKLQVSPKFGKN
jgi:hypothetical protein